MFIVIEIQKNGTTVNTIVDTYTELNEAKSKYHTILSYAAVSEVEKHAASILDDTGRCIFHEFYIHSSQGQGE